MCARLPSRRSLPLPLKQAAVLGGRRFPLGGATPAPPGEQVPSHTPQGVARRESGAREGAPGAPRLGAALRAAPFSLSLSLARAPASAPAPVRRRWSRPPRRRRSPAPPPCLHTHPCQLLPLPCGDAARARVHVARGVFLISGGDFSNCQRLRLYRPAARGAVAAARTRRARRRSHTRPPTHPGATQRPSAWEVGARSRARARGSKGGGAERARSARRSARSAAMADTEMGACTRVRVPRDMRHAWRRGGRCWAPARQQGGALICYLKHRFARVWPRGAPKRDIVPPQARHLPRMLACAWESDSWRRLPPCAPRRAQCCRALPQQRLSGRCAPGAPRRAPSEPLHPTSRGVGVCSYPTRASDPRQRSMRPEDRPRWCTLFDTRA